MGKFSNWAMMLSLSACLALPSACAHEDDHDDGHHDEHHSATAQAQYIANEGVLISVNKNGETSKIAFDPLFDNVFGRYTAVPEDMRTKILNGEAPFDGINVVLISHYHGDHFSPDDMALFLKNNPKTSFVAPKQAVDALMETSLAADLFSSNDDRQLVVIDLEYGAVPQYHSIGDVTIEAVRIPHAGGEGRRDIQNIVYRVSVSDEAATVIHMGDADPEIPFFEPYHDHWNAKQTHTAFPPYWFFLSEDGRTILDEHLNTDSAIGIHVPDALPDDREKRSEQFRDLDLFTTPGEVRPINIDKEETQTTEQ